MLEYMTCSAPLQTWKMLTRGFFATSVEWEAQITMCTANQIVACMPKKSGSFFLFFIFIEVIFCRHTSLSPLCRRQENVFCADDRFPPAHAARPAGSDNLASPAEIRAAEDF